MKVFEIVQELCKCNPYAEFEVVVNNTPKEFEILVGVSEGVTYRNCECVSITVDSDFEKE